MTWSYSMKFAASHIQACWLTAPGSLTRRLKELGSFRLEVLSEEICFPKLEETVGDESMPFETYWTREIVMHIDGRPCIFARSLIPREDGGVWSDARGIGGSPLGYILYNSTVRRTAFAFASYRSDHLAHNSHFEIEGPGPVLARRSRFLKKGIPILVSESFLPQFWDGVEHERLALECIG